MLAWGVELTHLVRPASQGDAPHPALVLLHGLGSNEHDLFMFAGQVDPRLVVMSLRAPLAYDYGGYMWYDMAEGTGLQGETISRNLAGLADFLQTLPERYDLDPDRMYLGGFSQGAAMAGATGLLHPDRVAGVIMLSGYLPPPDGDTRYFSGRAAGRPFFQANGTLDQIVLIDWGRATRDALQRAGVDLTYREYPMGHEVSLPEMMDLSRWLDARLQDAAS